MFCGDGGVTPECNESIARTLSKSHVYVVYTGFIPSDTRDVPNLCYISKQFIQKLNYNSTICILRKQI